MALAYNTIGAYNTAGGYAPLYSNTTGNNNTAFGYDALHTNTIGSNNIAVGYEAGYNLTAGNYNINIGNKGVTGDVGRMRFGTEGEQGYTFIAGISGTVVTGAAVYVTSKGQLGVLASSERYKTDVASMGVSTDKLVHLRPVTFRLKTDPQGTIQYGLIAEEVAKVYPELVIRGAGGRINGVRYEELTPMLLNEMQRQQQRLAAEDKQLTVLKEQLTSYDARIVAQDAKLEELKSLVATLTRQAEEKRVAMR